MTVLILIVKIHDSSLLKEDVIDGKMVINPLDVAIFLQGNHE